MSLGPRGLEQAAGQSRALAASAGWVQGCWETWPVVVAHEYRRLHDELRDGAVVPAILQLKDVTEVVIKLVAVVAGRLLTDAGSPRQRGMARDLLLAERPPPLGTWLTEGGRLCAEALKRDVPALQQTSSPFIPLLALLRDPLTREVAPMVQALRTIVDWRNRELGHGALRLDLAGYLPDLQSLLLSLNLHLSSHADAFQTIQLVAQGAADLVLSGSDALTRHQAALDSLAQRQRYVPLLLRAGDAMLSLAPYAYLHRTNDGELGCFVVDKRAGRLRSSRLQLLDYRTNAHAVARRADGEPALLAELDALAQDESDPPAGETPGGHAFDISVQRFLDSISVRHEYVSPVHFRDALRQFTGPPDAPARTRGIFWLSAPADVGKTTFAFSLATLGGANQLRESLGAGPLWEDMACMVFAARREYRSTSVSLEAHAFAELACAHNEVSLALSNYLRAPELALRPGAAFGAWLSAVRQQAAGRRGRLLLVLDALDELPTGEHRPLDHDLLRILPTADELPSGVFLLLTSRVDSARASPADANPADVQTVLADLQRRSDPALFQALVLDPQASQGAYHAVLRDFFDRRTRDMLPDDGTRAAVFQQVLEQGEHRFRQLAYFSAVIASGALRPEQVATLGRPLLEEHLAALRVHEGKRFALMKRILLELAAAEDAHVAELRWQEPAPVMPRAWLGLDMVELARRCDMPSERVGDLSPRFLIALQGCAELLRSFRGEASDRNRFALGLKGMVEQLQAIDGWSTAVVQRRLLLEGLNDFLAAQDGAAELAALGRAAGPALALAAQKRDFSLSRDTVRAVTRRANEIFQGLPSDSPIFIWASTAVLGLWLLIAPDDGEGDPWEAAGAWASVAFIRASARRARGELQAARSDAETAVRLYADWPQDTSAGQADRLRLSRLASGHLLVMILFDLEDFEACIQRADQVLSWANQPRTDEAPLQMDVLYFRAAAQRHAGHYEGAVASVDALLQAIAGHLPQARTEERATLMQRQAQSLKEQGVALRRLGQLDRALDVLGAAIEAYDRLLADDMADDRAAVTDYLAGGYSDRANVRQELGQLEEARADLERAIALLEAPLAEQPETERRIQTLALAHMNLGALHHKLGQMNLAAAHSHRSVQMRLSLRERMGERWTSSQQAGLALALLNRARAAATPAESVDHHLAALQAFQAIDDAQGAQMPAPVRNDWALCHQSFAAVLSDLHRHAEAADQHSQALAIIETSLQRSAAPLSQSLQALLVGACVARARALVMADQPAEALVDMNRAEGLAQFVGGDPLGLVRLWMQRAELQVILDAPEAAIRDLDRAVQALQALGVVDSLPEAARALLHRAWVRRGDVHAAISRPNAAVADYSLAIAELSSRVVEDAKDSEGLLRDLIALHKGRAQCHLESGRINEAHEDLVQAASGWEKLQDSAPAAWTLDDERQLNASYGLLLALYEGVRKDDDLVWHEALARLREVALQRRAASTWRLLLPMLEEPAPPTQARDGGATHSEPAPAAWALPPLLHGPWTEPHGETGRLCHHLAVDVLAMDALRDAPWPAPGLRMRLLRLNCFVRCWSLEVQLPPDAAHPPRLAMLWLTAGGATLLDGGLQTLVTLCGAGGLRLRSPSQALQYLEVAFAARRTALPRPRLILGPDDLPPPLRDAWSSWPEGVPPRDRHAEPQDDGGWLVPVWLHDGSDLICASFRISGDGLKIKQAGDALSCAEFTLPSVERWDAPFRWQEQVPADPMPDRAQAG